MKVNTPPRQSGEPLAGEEEVVWLEDVGGWPYVRETVVELDSRRGEPPTRAIGAHDRLVGYTTLGRGVRSLSTQRDAYRRRVFWLRRGELTRVLRGEVASRPAEGVRPADVEWALRLLRSLEAL